MERSKYDFSSVRVFVGVAALLLIAGLAAAQTAGHDVAEGLKLNVVKIEAVTAEHTENGFGFIVGERSGALYIATAYHVVSPPDAADLAPAKVKVQFYDHQGTTYDATLVTHDVAHDLGVLTVVPPQGFEWKKHCLGRTSEHQKLGTEVWNIGKTGDWSVPVMPGHIATDEIIDGVLNIEALAILPGSSGGPLIAPSGIVGLILRDGADNSAALSITYVKTLFVTRWNHPWNVELIDAPTPAVVAQVQPAVTPVVVPQPTPPAAAPAVAVNPLRDGWYELYSRNDQRVASDILLHLTKVSDDYFIAESTTALSRPVWSGELHGSGNAWDLKLADFRGPRIPVEGSVSNPGSRMNDISRQGPLMTFKSDLATFVWKETETRPTQPPPQTASAAPPPQSSAGAQLFGAIVGGLIQSQTGRTDRTPSDRCQAGFVWREARQDDHVCVKPETYQRTRYENATAAARRDPNGTYGRDTCLNGYVWRNAVYGDRVCVTEDSRAQAAMDNHYAGSRVNR